MGKEMINIKISDGARTGGKKLCYGMAAKRAITFLLNVITPAAADCKYQSSTMVLMLHANPDCVYVNNAVV